MAIYPDLFDPARATKELFLWASGFANSRCFGWGLPDTMLVPLADCFNHSIDTKVYCDIFEKNLHMQMNKIYLYSHNWDNNDEDNDDPDKIYDKTSSKIKVPCTKIFQEDEIAELPRDLLDRWEGHGDDPTLEKNSKKIYSRDLIFNRFKFNRKKHCGDGSYEEEKFEEDDEEFGK